MTNPLYVYKNYWEPGYEAGSLLQSYLSLITSEHQAAPKFLAAVQALTDGLVDEQHLLGMLSVIHDIDTSGGEQLDHIGEWVGFPRFVPVVIASNYFTWEDVAKGWEAGEWQGRFDTGNGMTRLSDDAYRIFLRAKIAANFWDGSLPKAFDVLALAFGDNKIIIQDNQDMSITIGFVGVVYDAATAELLTSGLLPLKPSGVRINFYALINVPGEKTFAWDSEGPVLGGWEEANWCREIYPVVPLVLPNYLTWNGTPLHGFEHALWQAGV